MERLRLLKPTELSERIVCLELELKRAQETIAGLEKVVVLEDQEECKENLDYYKTDKVLSCQLV